jgi:hypothetical protein
LEIQKQQIQEAKRLSKLKHPKKSLNRIQLEDLAMKEILQFYNTTSVAFSGEYFEVRTEEIIK